MDQLLAALPLPPLTLAFLWFMVFLAGFVDAIAGGGGLISLPAYLACGLPSHVAVGCNKFSSAVGTTFSTLRYFRNGAVDLFAGAVTAAAAFAGSAAGSHLLLLISDEAFRVVVVCVLPVAAVIILTRRGDALAADRSGELSRARKAALAAAIGLVIGCYDGLVGPGTGTFAIIAFNLLMHYDLRTAGGNAKCMNLASNYASLAVLLLAGKVTWAIAVPAAAFSIAGHVLGAGMALRRGARFIRPMLVVVLALLLGNLVSELLAG